MGRKINIDQIGLFVLGVTAIFLVSLSHTSPYQKYGYIVGLASQPFWLRSSFKARTWGIFWLSIIYTGVWLNGIRNHF